MRLGTLTTAAFLLALTSCADDGNDSDPPATEKEPQTVRLTVTLLDSVPLETLQGGSGGMCTSISMRSRLAGVATAAVDVTVRDADGSIVGTETLPELGGTYQQKTCTWPVEFEVDPSDFYEVTVTTPQGDVAGTAERADQEAAVEISL